MATSSSFLCRVKALYPFASEDPSSLRLEEGDYIDVLAKLPSGWWDGCRNGKRGWFPSNYVEVIENYGNTDVSPTTRHYKQMSTQSDLFDDKISENRTSLPPNWAVHQGQGGSTSYYLNTITGEMQSTYPYEDNNDFYDNYSDEDSTTSTIDSRQSPSTELLESQYSSSPFSEQGKWIQRTTPQGLPFFYNMSTHETAWHADSQEPQPKVHQLPISKSSFVEEVPDDELTWNKLSMHVTLCINNLISAIKSSQRSLYKKYAAIIVEAVRYMLVASGTINKESFHIKTSSTLRSHHRAMMASMSKLVLSAQLCADGTVSNVSKLLSDCNELLVAVRNFVSNCETIPIDIQITDPLLLMNYSKDPSLPLATMSGGIRAKYSLSQPDLIEHLDACGSCMQESMASLMSNLMRHSDSRCSLAVLLFTQYRNFGNQNGQFFSILEDVDFEAVSKSPLMNQLASSKQKLYDGLGILFCKMQTMTDETVSLGQVTKEMQDAAQSIVDAVTQVCDRMADIVAERNLQLGHEPKSVHHSSLCEDGEGHVFSDFLKNSTVSSHDLSLDLNLPSSIALNKKEGKRSKSLSSETDDHALSTHRLTNRASALLTQQQQQPTAQDNTRLMTGEILKHRAHTLNDTQSKSTSSKLKQIFGDDLPADSNAISPTTFSHYDTSVTNSTVDSRKTSTTPSKATGASTHMEESFLQYDYGPGEIVFTIDGNVKGGTLKALVERMTLHDYLDMNFNSTFLLTYRSFCTSMELLELLEERYNIQPPPLTKEELEIWITKKQKLIRLRVFNVLKIWLEQYYYEEDSIILDRLLFFTNTSIKDTLSFSAYQLERLIQKRKDACKDLKRMVVTQQQDCPDPILPRNLKKFRLLDLDATELARQLTLMDFKLYSSIKPVECLDKAWSRNDSIARNIQASIDYCNQVTTWVSDEILSQPEVKKRSILIKYWVNVAEKCRIYNNFNTCMAILSAFDNSAVGRLKRTWELVGARTNHVVSHIRKLMGANRNFSQYRVLIHSVNPPCIPFLGIYLQDLTFIEDGNPNFLKSSKNLINFAKRAKTAEVIREIQQYQTMGYQYRVVEEIQAFVTENLHSSRDEDQLYKESLKLEPKEREDEKITRLLQESGFL